MNSVPFCVLERPYAYWGRDVVEENTQFLVGLDGLVYYRTAQMLIHELPEDREDDDKGRKDISSLARLLWHHGLETLVMLLGAFIQAPTAAKGYFLKCQSHDVRELTRLLVREQLPRYNRVEETDFTISALVAGLHRWTGWDNIETIVERQSFALRRMLADFEKPQQRFEYNSIKHGFRANHGRFALAMGQEESPGVLAPGESMRLIGSSKDSSHFDVEKEIRDTTKAQSRVNFATEKTSLAWSLERVLCELQITSFLIENAAGALRIINGVEPKNVQFHRQVDGDEFWELYPKMGSGSVNQATFGVEISSNDFGLYDAKQVFESYLGSNLSE